MTQSMMQPFDADRFATAAARFREFFTELEEAFVEREDNIVQFQLALLSREHVLMTGPPGTAKSQMATAVLRRIVDESTGAPSVFARQFTENTVQTDLIGPIDFKTLMESGRTEHFTDEGILGAVHAFLDEVFDGRDMLLRSTLNLLHERELKQGGVTTTGRIESAFMTSNRYIAEILENARETLLAFLDRIAFVSFVPRGFANANNLALVVRRHGGGFGRHQLSAPLSIQDLDVLQSAVERTFLPEKVCDGLADLLRELDAEQAAAMRADREYQPTRYLSTRTAVRSAGIARAAAVREQIFGRNDRPFMVQWNDLRYLRYHLILSGMSRDRIAALMNHETDPRERRQLDIMRTEAEIFDRCLAKIPRPTLPDAPPKVDLDRLTRMLGQAKQAGNSQALVNAARSLAQASESGATGADGATRLLSETVGLLSEQALQAGLVPHVAERSGNFDIDSAERLATLADDLEEAMGASRPLARWLRGRMLELVDESLRLSATVTPESVQVLLGDPSRRALTEQIDARLQAAETLYQLRKRMDVKGAWMSDAATSKAAWHMALSKLEDELVLLWDARFREATKSLLSAASRRKSTDVFADLSPHLSALDTDVTRLQALGWDDERPTQLRKRVVGPRIEPLISAVFEALAIKERKQLVDEVANMVQKLDQAGLGELIDPERFVAWSAPALLRAERDSDREAPPVNDATTYKFAHDREDPLSLVQTLTEIALRVVPPDSLEPEHPELATRAIWQVVRGIRPELQNQIAELDLMRINRGVTRLTEWWTSLSESKERARAEPAQAVSLLENAVRTGFLKVMRSGDPLALALEAKHLAEVFSDYAGRANSLRKRLRQLDQDSTGLLVELLEGHAQRAWDDALTGADGAEQRG